MDMEQMLARLLVEMKAEIRTNQAKTDVDPKEVKTKPYSNQEEIRASKEETKVTINSIRSELEEATKNRMQNVLACVHQQPTRVMGR
jgi:hypothetical protein